MSWGRGFPRGSPSDARPVADVMAQSGGIDASARTTSRTDRSTRTPHLRCKSDMRDGRVSVPREFRDWVCPKSAHKICSGDLCLSFRLLHGSDPRQAPKRPTSPRTGQPPPSQEMALECLTETPHPLEHGPTSAKGRYTPDESTTGSRGEPTFDHRNPRLLSDLGPLQLLKTVFYPDHSDTGLSSPVHTCAGGAHALPIPHTVFAAHLFPVRAHPIRLRASPALCAHTATLGAHLLCASRVALCGGVRPLHLYPHVRKESRPETLSCLARGIAFGGLHLHLLIANPTLPRALSHAPQTDHGHIVPPLCCAPEPMRDIDCLPTRVPHQLKH